MEKAEWFESWFGSPYYRILYQQRDELEAQEFIEALLRYLQPLPGSRMVDIACGEGRYSIQLASHGYDVTGIDLSYRSIEKAKQAEKNNLHFYVQDMRFPFYINYFDHAFNFFTSFGYFNSPRDNQMAAKSFAKGLKQGGILVLDYLNKDYVINHLVPGETVARGDYSFDITRKMEGSYIIKDIRFTDEAGTERHFNEKVAAFGLSDFTKIFRTAGLSLVGTFGDYKLGPFSPLDSPRLIMIFKK
jgi:SAM-dependent methyltransferase